MYENVTHDASTEITLCMSRLLVMTNEEWGMEISRMEAAISTTRHSPTKPITDGLTNSNSSLVVMLEGESFTLRLPRTRTTYLKRLVVYIIMVTTVK